ncbi:MAG: hypothetical protein ACO1SV_25655 [Fimbriimonas sp.]
MKRLGILILLAVAAFPAGCGEGKTPEEIEAAKYPKAKALTAEEEAKVRELTQQRPPANTQGTP